MTNSRSAMDWRLYERIAATVEAENNSRGIETSITLNAKLRGAISGISRQVDLLIDSRWAEDVSRRVIVDVKKYKRRINIKDVESFEGMMRDCRADRGILVCPSGWSRSAETRANDTITIKLLTLSEAEEHSYWAHQDLCYGSCVQKPKETLRGVVFWDGEFLLERDGLFIVILTGKCDVCREFHAWCWDCGEIIALGQEDDYVCHCGRIWTTAISEEPNLTDGSVRYDHYLLLLANGSLVVLDHLRHIPVPEAPGH